MHRLLITLLFPLTFYSQTCERLSQDVLYAVKSVENPQVYMDSLANLNLEQLLQEIHNDDLKKAFWLNIYNAYVQYSLKQNPEKWTNRKNFYADDFIRIAGYNLSLDFIEHGIIRHSKNKYSLGYISKLFPGKLEKKLRVDTLDYRIHFALNCGAKSCPAVAFYESAYIDAQLQSSCEGYIQAESTYKKEENTVYIPALFSWFRADFSGKKNIYMLLEQNNIIPENTRPKIAYTKYDWNLDSGKYR